MLVHQMWDRHIDEKVLYRYHDQSITYGMFKEKIELVRNYFYSEGIRRGQNVGLYCKNCPEFVEAYFAIVSLGAVVVPLNRTLTPNEVAYIAEDAEMQVIVSMQKLDLDGKYKQLLIPDYTTQLEATDVKQPPQLEDVNEDDVTVIIYTSGTTGHPKGAMLTHKNLVSNTKGIVNALGIQAEDRILCVLPMFHSFAWTTTVLSALYCGATTVIVENFHPKDTVKTIFEEKATIVCGVPTMYNYYLMVGSPEVFQSVRCFVSGGASLPVEVTANFKHKIGISIVEGYGLSEASPVVAVNPMEHVKVGSIGVPLEDVEVKIVDGEGHELPVSEVGELTVNGPNVMKGYFNLPEVTARTIVDNWLHTGDLAYKDEDGYLFIVDRLKDIIIVSGMNVYPREVEEVIYQYAGIVEATVIGVPDKTRGEAVAAFIVTEDNKTFDKKGFKKFLREKLANFKLPREIILKETLPKNATGKIMKKTLREMHKA